MSLLIMEFIEGKWETFVDLSGKSPESELAEYKRITNQLIENGRSHATTQNGHRYILDTYQMKLKLVLDGEALELERRS